MKPALAQHQYDDLTALMDRLADEGAIEDNHPLKDLFVLAADLAYAYEQSAHPLPAVSGVAMLRFLMEQHGLRQSDLVEEIGSQGLASEILSGKRELNKHHITALAERFGVSPAVFFD